MNFKGFSVFLCVSISSAAAGQTQNQCSMEMATSMVMERAWGLRAQSGSTVVSILNQMETINNKAKKPHVPIAEQLNPRDLAKFAELGNRLKTIQLSRYVESGLDRDARVVQTMYDTAWQWYAEPTSTPPESDFASLTLGALRFMFPKAIDVKPVSTEECSIDTVLATEIDKSATRLISNTESINRLLPLLQALKAKYSVAESEQLDQSKMKPEDRREAQRIMTQLQPSYRERDLMLDLQHALEWWRAAKLVYESRREDIRIYGGSVEDIGKTLNSKLANAPDRLKQYVGLWNAMNDKIPSEAMKEGEQLDRVRAEAEKK